MTCNCINTINTLLKEKQNGALDTGLFGSVSGGWSERPVVRIIRQDTGNAEKRSGKAGTFAVKFCPFCGERYDAVVAGEVA